MKYLTMESDDLSISSNSAQLVPIKIYIPDLLIQKVLHFHKDDLLFDIKQQIIDSLPKELKDHFNYGLFCPPVNSKAGKFLDEQRPLADYPFPEPVGYLELRYKRRVYKIMNLEEKQIKQLHTRASLRRMLDHVASGQVEKIMKMCARGMDPNFHCPETGETPLTTATALRQPAKVVMALVNGGALLDFRTKHGQTALHKAVQKNSLEALKTLLDLGASPNYKDSRGLTPLYYSVLHSSDPQLTEVLLHDHAVIGTCDHQGWQEVHQACKHGLVQHLEHILFYGADMNARNASGNTPLHVCAVNDQENCARVLLFRGGDKESLNFANQSPYQVAVIAGNLALAEVIKNHCDDDIVPYRETPSYNPRRRASMAIPSHLNRTHSDPRLELTGGLMMMMKPPSPCPSNCSLPPFSSSASCISEASTGSSSTCTRTSSGEDAGSLSIVTERSATSDSSGVCTSNSGASFEERPLEECEDNGSQYSSTASGTVCVCTKDYSSSQSNHLQLRIGDIVEVMNTVSEGLLEGRADDGRMGFFPSFVVQEGEPKSLQQRVKGRREINAHKVNTTPRRWKRFGEPRTVILHKGKRGFGFVLRGAKATSPLMEREPNEFWPSLQYLDDVDGGGVADLAGLQKGDFLLEINGQDVSQASHEEVVSIIRLSGDLVAMSVITVHGQPAEVKERSTAMQRRQCATLPHKLSVKKAPAPPKRDPRTTLTVGRFRAQSMVAGLAEIEALDETLCAYDSEGRSTKSSSVESIPNKQRGQPSNFQNIASIRARPSSQKISASELKRFFSRQETLMIPYNSHETKWKSPKVYGSVAAMKRSKAMKIKLSDIVGKIHKEFHSTPELNSKAINEDEKKSQSEENFSNSINSLNLLSCTGAFDTHNKLCFKKYKSIEDVCNVSVPSVISDDAIYAQTLPLLKSERLPHRASFPPPSHPPPPPPVGQMVKVNVSKAISEYANVNVLNDDNEIGVMSSFRPGDSAKLYASPEVILSVGYKQSLFPQNEATLHPRRTGGGSSLRSHSLPPKVTNNERCEEDASEKQNSLDSSSLYATLKTPSRQRDSLSSDSGHVSDKGALRVPKGKQQVSSSFGSKFDLDDSDVSGSQNYVTVRSVNHEPFIPEPDYESSEDEDLPLIVDQSVTLSTFGKGDESTDVSKFPDENRCESPSYVCPSSPHSEAKRAIQQARERLRFSQKPSNKNATVVFISGKITKKKVEKSEIQLHRNEEGRLTGTVVISTTNEASKPLYMTSPVIKGSDTEASLISHYPSRDAPASEYAKYRQQILSGLTKKSVMPSPVDSSADEHINEVNENNGIIPSLIDGKDVHIENMNGTDASVEKKDLHVIVVGAEENECSEASGEQITYPAASEPRDNVNCCAKTPHSETQKNHSIVELGFEEKGGGKELVVQYSQATVAKVMEVDNVMQAAHNIESEARCPQDRSSSGTVKQQISVENAVSSDEQMLLIDVNKNSKCSLDSSKIKADADLLNSRAAHPVSNSSAVISAKCKTDMHKDVRHHTAENLDPLKLREKPQNTFEECELDIFTELVPPPPEFAAPHSGMKQIRMSEPYAFPIAPPPEFCDSSSSSLCKSRCSIVKQRYQLPSQSSADHIALLSSLCKGVVSTGQSVIARVGHPSKTAHCECSSSAKIQHYQLKPEQKEFRYKALPTWTTQDIADWLDSLFLSEYKQQFAKAGITGAKLLNMDSNDLMGLGVKQMGHRLNMERSVKRYLR